MPPRIPNSRTTTASSALIQEASQWKCHNCRNRLFSSSPTQSTRLRRDMFSWLNGPGRAFKDALPGSTNYLGAYDKKGRLKRQKAPTSDSSDKTSTESGSKANTPGLEKETVQDLRPFPHNFNFYSQSILSEELRNEIYRRVKVLGQPVRLVSAQLGVEMRRVGAVVRLGEIERQWKEQGKPLATPYARAVHEMVPTTPYTPNKPTAHESINDLPVHALTSPQIFWPTSESRLFNRTDAGRVFSGANRLPDGDTSPSTSPPEHFETVGKPGHERQVLLPADARIPHPHLIEYHRDELRPEFGQNRDLLTARYNERIQLELQKTKERKEKQMAREERATTRVQTARWDFLFKEVQATRQGTGMDGRGTKSPGHRYGYPLPDRKRGQGKIPTKVTV